MSFSTLNDAYAWLDSRIDYEQRLGALRYDDATFGLDDFRRRLADLGDPHDSLTTIHIAGTRGKGSAALMLEALLRASGERTAVYTSPHLREYRERVRIDGASIAGAGFARLLWPAARSASLGESHPTGFKTVFESLTALFFLAAKEAMVDRAIVETGLGGRLDATNVLAPGPVLLTRIGLEHTRLLGSTHAAIAAEKAAILKAGAWGVAGAQSHPDVWEVFERRAALVGAKLVRAEEICPLIGVRPRPDGQAIAIMFEGMPLEIDLPLIGCFVAENLQNALAVLSELRGRGDAAATPVAELIAGLRALKLPGRMERVCRRPELFADGAHCPTGAFALAATMAAHFANQPADLVVGMLDDKDHAGFFRELAAWSGWRRLVLYQPDSLRAANPEKLAAAAAPFFAATTICPDLGDALQFLTFGDEKECRAVAAGTLYSAGALQDWGGERDRWHEPAGQRAQAPESGAASGHS